MPTQHVRISERSYRTLKDLAKTEGDTLQHILDKAVEDYRRASFIREANAEYAALKDDPAAWADELQERAEWEQTVGDGLNND